MADQEKDVVITISAKNLTEKEFKQVAGGLTGIENKATKASKKTGVLARSFKALGKAAPGALKAVSIGAGAAAAAIAGAALAVQKLGERGATVGDVRSQFDALSEAAGETGSVMLTELAAGVKGTIGNFDLMKVANKALGAGLLSSSEDARTMSEGARLLAKRTGGDTVQAFNTLTTAMASGRTAQLKQIGLFVDNKQAIEDYAAANGTTVSKMNDVDRAAALQAATMAALRGEIANFPPPLADFGELIEKGRVFVGNLVDELAVMISESPVLISGMRAAGEAITGAFGGNSQGFITTVVQLIEKGAFFAISFGQAMVGAAQMIVQGWAGIKVLVFQTALALGTFQLKMQETIISIAETAAKIPGLGGAFEFVAEKARVVADATAKNNEELRKASEDAGLAALGQDTLGLALTKAQEVLTLTNQGMVNAGTTTSGLTEKTRELTQATTDETAAQITWAETLEGTTPFFQMHWANLEKTRLAVNELGDNSVIAFNNANQAAGSFVPVIQGVGDLTAVATNRMTDAFHHFGLQTQAELDETARIAVENFNMIQESGEKSAEELAEIWKEVETAKREASGETEEFTLTSNEAILTGSTQILNQLGQKNKAAAIAQAVIATGQAVAKSLAAAPWPASLILAAGALAAGIANVNKIRSSNAFATGTAGLDFENFGTESPAALHGMEAIIPRGSGHMLGREVAGELARMRPQSGGDSAELAGVASQLRDLPTAIARSVRDGMLLAAG